MTKDNLAAADITQLEIDGDMPIARLLSALASAGLTLHTSPTSNRLRIVEQRPFVPARARGRVADCNEIIETLYPKRALVTAELTRAESRQP